jgi:hypothetical protein
VSRHQSGQTGAHDNNPPRLLRRSNRPPAEGKHIERRDGHPGRREQMAQKVASIELVHMTSAETM